MTDQERRRNQRMPTEFEVNYVHDGDYVISLTKDISADGMFIHTDSPPPVGDTPNLIFSIGDLREIKVRAQVMWVNTKDNGLDRGMGVQFIDTPADLKEAILRNINRVAVFTPKTKRSTKDPASSPHPAHGPYQPFVGKVRVQSRFLPWHCPGQNRAAPPGPVPFLRHSPALPLFDCAPALPLATTAQLTLTPHPAEPYGYGYGYGPTENAGFWFDDNRKPL